MDAADYEDGIDVLRRLPVLDACLDGPLTRSQLTDETALSRTTAYRATVALVERGLLTDTGSGYRTTPRGAATAAAAETFLGGVETVDRLDPLLDLVDHPELVANAHLLEDARVVVADASNPYRVVDRVLERFEQTSASRGTLASVSSAEAIDRAMPSPERAGSIERIFAKSALEAHETVGKEGFAAATTAASVTILVAADEDVPFSFAIDDEDVTVVGHDPATGLPTVHVESESESARAWLDRLYERCRDAARPV